MYVMIYLNDSNVEKVFRFDKLDDAVENAYNFTLKEGFFTEEEMKDSGKLEDFKSEIAEDHYIESTVDDMKWIVIRKTWEMGDSPKPL